MLRMSTKHGKVELVDNFQKMVVGGIQSKALKTASFAMPGYNIDICER